MKVNVMGDASYPRDIEIQGSSDDEPVAMAAKKKGAVPKQQAPPPPVLKQQAPIHAAAPTVGGSRLPSTCSWIACHEAFAITAIRLSPWGSTIARTPLEPEHLHLG